MYMYSLVAAIVALGLATPATGFVLVSSATGLHVRPLRSSDIFAASRLLLDVFTERDDVPLLSRPLILAEHFVGLRERRDTNVVLICQQPTSKEIVGFVEMYTPEFLASQVPDLPPSAASILQPYVANLAVSARARKSGVASALMRTCEQKARDAGCRVISLQVYDFNTPALELYKQLGYEITGRDTNCRRLVGDLLFGKSVPATKISLEKSLT